MGTYTVKLAHDFALESGLGLGQQGMSITLQDEFGHSLPFHEASLVLNAELRLSWRPPGSLAWSIWQRWIDSSWDYGRLGTLSGRRWESGLGMGWHFGGRARRIQ
jgi:hypothetical protein